MHLFIYNLFCKLYLLGIHIVALWNRKAAAWKKGRQNWSSRLENISLKSANSFTIWMHCASLGEFEQGRPVLEALKSQYPSAKIVLTFFSPSGYEIRKNYSGADLVIYLPMDSKKNARKFIELINPQLVLWVKYEYWYHYLTQLKKRNIPVLMVSGIYRPGQTFFKPWGRLHRYMLDAFTHFFVQNESSASLLQSIHIHEEKITVTNDTRFDRVAAIAKEAKNFPAVQSFCNGYQIIVAGSTWEADEEILSHYINVNNSIRFIIAAHEVDEEHLKDIEQLFKNTVRYSELIKNPAAVVTAHTLIIDNIGMLASLYQYASITYIGGGFNKSGIHNTLEAAVYGKPVVFGPVYEKFAEAKAMVEKQIAYSVSTALELEEVLNLLFKDEALYKKTCREAGEYVQSQTGATEKIMLFITENVFSPTSKTPG